MLKSKCVLKYRSMRVEIQSDVAVILHHWIKETFSHFVIVLPVIILNFY